MSALACSSSTAGSGAAPRPQARQPRRAAAAGAAPRRARGPAPAAALWTPPGAAPQQGWTNGHATGASPLSIQANGQPIMAPRTADMAGDPFGLLLRQRIIFLGGEVDDFGADAIVSQLLLLDQQDATKDIKLFINSPGGSVTAGMGIYDAMMLCRADVQTYCFGLAASMGAFLLGAGRKGKRYSMPNSRIMIHQPLGGASGQAVDIEIQAKEIMYHKANINRIMSDYCSQPLSKIEEDTDRDRYMSPIEARDYGVIDHIIGGDEAVFRNKASAVKAAAAARLEASMTQDTE
ncbi:MAG: Clp protease-domain-containing protein [Monoraphidium minutum]|nr:MAG: Clp protease-domain-containing protein [Monoraphidium minutum]